METKTPMEPPEAEQTQPQEQDTFARLIGHLGRWQLLVFLSIFLIKVPSGWVQLCILFLTPQTTFRCVEFSSNHSEVTESNRCYEDCLQYEYETSVMKSTVISEWGLICQRAWLASFTQTLMQFGILIGSVIFGFLADRYGRKLTFLIAVTCMTAVGVVVPFVPNYELFTALRLLLGVATAGTMVVSFVLVMETVGPRYRELFGGIYQIPFMFGHLLVPLTAYFCREWRVYLLVLGCTNLVFLGYFFTLHESPRWLLSVGRVDDAAKILVRAAKMNKLPSENIPDALTKAALEARERSTPEAKHNYSALMRRGLRQRTLCSLLMWLVSGFTFFGFNQYIGQSSPDPFLSVSATAFVQLPANMLSVYLTRRCGRRITSAGSFLVCGASIIALGARAHSPWLALALATLGAGAAALNCTCIYIYSSELFPTVVRNMGVGVSSMAMRTGSMAAPFVANLAPAVPWLPTALFGIAPISAAALVLLLPETRGRPLPDSINDVTSDNTAQTTS